MSIKVQLKAFVNLVISDKHVAHEELELLYMIAAAHNVDKKTVDQMLQHPEPVGDLSTLTEEEKFHLLYNIVQLMKVDRKVYMVEIRYCEEIAKKLGYKKKVIDELSSRIYANPAITTDWEYLREVVNKYRE